MTAPRPRAIRALAGVAGVAAVLGAVAAPTLGTTATGAAWSVAALAAAGAVAAHLRAPERATDVAVPVEDPEEPFQPVRTAARRAVLLAAGGIGVAAATLGGAVGGVLLARAGPRQPTGTAWRAGTHLVTEEGRRLRAEDVPRGGIATVWPEDAIGDPRSAVLLVTVTATGFAPPTVPAWVVDGRIVGYSKVCTHAGCMVGLFRTDADVLYCPCHQAMFDAARGAVPVFGPASKPLPQLPLGTDSGGYLVSTGDFQVPIGPPRA